MKNALKLITDKTKYTCTDAEQVITITNLDELGARNVLLSSDSINKYPIKSIDGENLTVDVTSIKNNDHQVFRVFAEYDLPLLEVSNIQKSYEQNISYPFHIKIGDWHTGNGYRIECVVGEDENIILNAGTAFLSDINGDYFESSIIFRNAEMPVGEHTIRFRLCISHTSNTDGAIYEYFCETEPILIEILPSTTAPKYGGVFIDATEIIFEANKTYYLPISTTIKHNRLYPAISITYTTPTPAGTSTKIKRFNCEMVDNMLKVDFPYYDDLPANSYIRFTCAFFEEPFKDGDDWLANLAYSTTYDAYYFANI